MPDPVKTALVKIWDRLVGAVAWDADRDVAMFEFDGSFPSSGFDLAPVHMSLEDISRGSRKFTFRALPRETFFGLPGMLADALPDRFGNRLIDAWLARQGRTAGDFSPVERLCYMGERAMGALTFEPPIDRNLDTSSPVDVSDLVDLAQQALDERLRLDVNLDDRPTEALLDIIRVGTSAGGMRPKAVIALNEVTNEVRSGQVRAPEGFGYWILKFDGIRDETLGDPAGYGRVEYAYHLMAAAAGIDMTECRLLEEGGRAHFLTRRFDRVGSGDRLHLQSLCALQHFDFNSPGSYSYEQAFATIRQLRLPFQAVEQQFRRMVFNIAGRNCDDHTKNIAFLMNAEGRWSLAPAFDVILAYNPDGLFTSRHQMTVNGKRDGIDRNDLISVGWEASIRSPGIIIDEIVEAVAGWPHFARQAGVPEERIRVIGKLHMRL